MALLDIFNSFKSKAQGKAGLVGVSISGQEMSLAHVTVEKDSPKLMVCESFSASTKEEQQKGLTLAIEDLGLEGSKCNFVLPREDYNLLLVEAPNVEASELSASVKWKIKDMIDRPIEEIVVSVFPIPSDAYRSPNDMVYVVAAKKNKVEEFVELIAESGLVLDVIDIPELVMKNLSTSYSSDKNGLAFIELLGSGSTMNMCKEGAIYLTRHLNTPVEQSILGTSTWDTVKDRLVLEIQRSLDYYESQMGQRQIAKLLVAPRQKDSVEMVKELDGAMAVNVEIMNLRECLNYEAELPLELQQTCMMAIGGALRVEQGAA